MKTARVTTDSLAVHAQPGERIITYLKRGDRVGIIGAPVHRDRRWWQIERAGAPQHGWVAEGDGKTLWLTIEPEHESAAPLAAPADKPPTTPYPGRPTIPFVDPPSPWWPLAIIIAIGLITLLAWFAS